MILVSACLLGKKVKYDGGANDNELLLKYESTGCFLPVCPECIGGLNTPRKSAEIQKGTGADVIAGRTVVSDKDGKDVTAEFVRGAEGLLELVRKHNVKIAVLKENSPSCGNANIYDGTFSHKKISGQGVAASLISEAGVTIYSENDLTEDLVKDLIQADMAENGKL